MIKLKDLLPNWINLLKRISRKYSKKVVKVSVDYGAFTYYAGGVTIYHNRSSLNLSWNTVCQINVFKTDLITVDRIEMEIICSDKVIFVNEDFPGFDQFIIKTKAIFPSIPNDWDTSIVKPGFERSFKTIYNASSAQVLAGDILYEKLKSLNKIGQDKDWNIFYLDKEGVKWVLSFPNAGYHGGGAPLLTRVEFFPGEQMTGL